MPAAAVLAAERVNELPWVTGFNEKDPVTPAGRPDTARLTLPANPYCGLMATAPETEFPMPTVSGPGPVSVKDGVLTESRMVVFAVCEPP